MEARSAHSECADTSGNTSHKKNRFLSGLAQITSYFYHHQIQIYQLPLKRIFHVFWRYFRPSFAKKDGIGLVQSKMWMISKNLCS